jgi:serine/threonine protein kinase
MSDLDPLGTLRSVLSAHGYDLLNPIGSGSYSCVYTVLSRKYAGVIFAAKVMTLPESESTCECFHREIDILTKLSHPLVVSLFDTFSAGSEFVLILEYCNNGPIDRYLRTKKLPEIHLVRMMKQILSALAHCHSVGVAHRDLKPANILIDHYERPKLVDFGLSCFVDGLDGPRYAGSLHYMAPEIVRRVSTSDLFLADIWSLGITFYVLFVGATPWRKFLPQPELIAAIAEGAFEYPVGMDPSVQAFLARMLAPDPADRASAEELLGDAIFAQVDSRPVALLRVKDAALGTRRPSRERPVTGMAHAQSAGPLRGRLEKPSRAAWAQTKRFSGDGAQMPRLMVSQSPRRHSVAVAPSPSPIQGPPSDIP